MVESIEADERMDDAGFESGACVRLGVGRVKSAARVQAGGGGFARRRGKMVGGCLRETYIIYVVGLR